MRNFGVVVFAALFFVCAAASGAEGACSSCSACASSGISEKTSAAVPCATGNNALRKLGRGCANVCTFPIEIYNQMDRAHGEGGPMAAFTWGLVKGIGMMGVRVVVGVYEIATFPFPVPADYRPILTDPEFFFQDQAF